MDSNSNSNPFWFSFFMEASRLLVMKILWEIIGTNGKTEKRRSSCLTVEFRVLFVYCWCLEGRRRRRMWIIYYCTLMMGKTDWTSSFNTSKRLVSLPLTSSAPSLWPAVEWLRIVQLHRARTPSMPKSELRSLCWSSLTASNQVNISWLLILSETSFLFLYLHKNGGRQAGRQAPTMHALLAVIYYLVQGEEKEKVNIYFWFELEEVGTEKLRTAVTAAAMCLALTSKLSDQAGLDVWVEMIFRPCFTLALQQTTKIMIQNKTINEEILTRWNEVHEVHVPMKGDPTDRKTMEGRKGQKAKTKRDSDRKRFPWRVGCDTTPHHIVHILYSTVQNTQTRTEGERMRKTIRFTSREMRDARVSL